MAKSSVGIILRSKTVEVFEAQRGPGGLHLTKIASEPIPETDPSHPASGELSGVEHAGVPQAIQTALSRARVKASHVGVSVASPDVLLRSFTLPIIPQDEREPAVQFEARKYLPFKITDLVWNFRAIEQRGSKDLAVVFVGIKAEAFARIQGWLTEAGVKPSFIEAQWVSLARLAPEMPKDSENQFVGIVDIEPHTAHIVITKDHAPYLARDVNLNLDLSASPHTAQAGQEAMASGRAAIDLKAEVLLSELRLSIDFFQREHPTASISHLWLFGDPAMIEPWCSWLASQLPCSVAMGTLPPEFSPAPTTTLQLACGAGAVLRVFRAAGTKLDFQGRETSSTSTNSKMSWAQWPRVAEWLSQGRLTGLLQSVAKPLAFQGMMACASLIAMSVLSHQQLDKKRRELMTLTQGVTQTGWGLQGKSKEELETLQAQVNTRFIVLRETIQQRVSVAEKLDALAKALPEGVWLEKLAYQDPVENPGPNRPSLTIQGACFLPHAGGELRVISDFIHSIKDQPRFFRGFTATKLGQIDVKEDRAATQAYSYRTFALNCESEATTLKRGERIQ